MSTSDKIKNVLAPYLLIGGIGGGIALILMFALVYFSGFNPLNSEFLFWDVILLAFTVFLASLNYHIKNAFKSYKILQTIVLNALAALLGIMIYVSFMNIALPKMEDTVKEYKDKSIEEINNNRESFIARGLKENEIDIYLKDIEEKTAGNISADTLQKLFLASPFIVFISFVLILLMHFVMILSRDRLIKKNNHNGK
ncbi:MAG: hypothetical protein RH860_06770 [Cytophagales bacterium]